MVFVLEKFIVCLIKQYVCAQQIYARAQSLKSVCMHTRALLTGNTAYTLDTRNF